MSELATRPPGSTSERALSGEVIDPCDLAARAAEVAARQRSPETRRTYAAVYRSFAAFLGAHARPEELTPTTVRAYRDALERAGRSPATVAKQLTCWVRVPVRRPRASEPQDAGQRDISAAPVAGVFLP